MLLITKCHYFKLAVFWIFTLGYFLQPNCVLQHGNFPPATSILGMAHLSFQLASFSYLLGKLLTIFYKRNRLLPVAAVALLWVLTSLSENQTVTFLKVASTIIYVLKETRQLSTKEKVKSFVTSLTIFLTTQQSGDVLAYSVVVCATTHFARWPVGLEDVLRELRITFGPVYVLLVTGACVQSGLNILLTVSTLMSLFVAILLQPDNNEVVRMLGFGTFHTQTRKLTHGLLMFMSFVLITAYSMLSFTVYGSFVLGILNGFWYFVAADLR